jgi:hypothetical protein
MEIKMNEKILKEVRILKEIAEVSYKLQEKCMGYLAALEIALNRAKKPVKIEELREIIIAYNFEHINEEEIPYPIFELHDAISVKRIAFAHTLLLPGYGIAAHDFNYIDVILLAKRFKKVGWYSLKYNEGYILEFEDFIKELKKIAEELKDDEYIYNRIKCWIEYLET